MEPGSDLIDWHISVGRVQLLLHDRKPDKLVSCFLPEIRMIWQDSSAPIARIILSTDVYSASTSSVKIRDISLPDGEV